MARAKIFDIPGKDFESPINNRVSGEFIHLVLVDENYMSVAVHLDQNTKDKIKAGQYVDFSKLVPKDRIFTEDDNRVQLIIKGGNTYFVPASDNSSTTISSINHWDQAFRVLSDIYCKFHPNRSTELIQYSHVIHTAAAMYVWDNVYAYDHDFRLHLATNPGRSWSIILQQAWAMRLKDRLKFHDNSTGGGNKYNQNGSSDKNRNSKDFCKRFNRGRCTYGARCRYDHRCSYCFKPGHGLHNCRKFTTDQRRDGEYRAGGPPSTTTTTATTITIIKRIEHCHG